MAAARLLGRRSECETLDHLLADAAGGTSRVLVLRGDAGVGKTALLRYLADRVAGWHVATAVGVESEMELAYSGLHQLCAPLLDRVDRLPGPQRDALEIVFGLGTGPPPDRFLVGLAALTLLAETAEHQPLICIIDDAQWLDDATAQTVAFVARRLLAERIALVFAARAGIGEDVLTGLPALPIGGLSEDVARTLLLRNVHGPLDPAVRDQVVAESHGNPLALLELPRTWRAGRLAGGFGLPEGQPVAGKIEQSYLRRLFELPADTQVLALAAAAEPLGAPVLLHRAAETLGLDLAATEPAEDAGLLHLGGRVEFAHPLVRSAIYRAATAADRRRVHRALAEATDAGADPDRRAWHRARATPGPDEEVAAELERSAGRAQARGGLAAGAAFLTRATELTPDPTTRVRRALGAAAANMEAGAFDPARAQLMIAAAGPLGDLDHARIDLLRAQLAFVSNRGNEATPLLLAAAGRLEPLDLGLARETYLDTFSAALFGARLNETVTVSDVANAVQAAPRRPDADVTPVDLILDAFVAFTQDYASAVQPGQALLRRLCADPALAQEKLRWLWHGTIIGLEVWDDESAYLLSQQHVQRARKAGALSEFALALSSRTPVLVFAGELAAATALVAEAQTVEEATGITAAPYGALIVAAWRGQSREARAMIEATMREAGSRGEGIGVAISQYTRAVLGNGLGQYEEAAIAAHSASEYRELVAENWGLTELVEAASRTGQVELAGGALDRLDRKARAAGTDWALAMVARSRALLSEGDEAEDLFRAAITGLAGTRVRAELARTHLLYGEWLRRSGRRVDARAELTTAFDLARTIGMQAFAERAGRELLATGAVVRKRTVEARDDLTAQEAQIAQLASDGLSNPEIGAQLFISSRTVEWHLRKIFTKLGISSRRQLRSALAR